ncbi:MAG TPA: RagB/SusD family nutrient uptake outer membrane protein [Bacteroidales bacterium]|nr:RagB/SusD family nutrient uptake outer membrane protein [Bacteroidales bacterium]
MKINKIISALTLFILILVSCSDEWLKPDPLSFFAPENVYVDEAGFESGLIRCRKEMNAENHGYMNPIAVDVMYTDVAVPLRQSNFNQNTPSLVQQVPLVLTIFSNTYGYIKNANTIISRIDNITWANESIRNRILSEAFWFRAYWYYRLVHTYGDIPWVGEELTGAKLDYNSTTRWAILAKIQQDLEFAVQWLPVTPAALGNVTKGAANHLLAKVYLANCEFDKAINATTAVINGPYALMKQRFGVDAAKKWHNVMWDLHRYQNKNLSVNKETIYATVDRPEAPTETWWSNPGTYSMRLYTPSYWKVLDVTGNRACNWQTIPGDTLGIGNGDVRTNDFWHYWMWNEAGYTWENTPDMRRAPNNWIEMGKETAEIITVRPGSPNFGEPLTKLYYKSLADTTDTWYPWPQYKTYTPTPNYHQPHGGQGDWYTFRLAETYLLRAEAYFWKGQFDLAAADINVVRERAHAPLITAADATIDYIFTERVKELYTEEPRHSEMVRASFIFAKLNLDGYSLSTISAKNWYYDRVMKYNPFYKDPKYRFWDNTANMSPKHMLWPIPQSVITANTMGVINQNYGYDGYENNVPPLETIP